MTEDSAHLIERAAQRLRGLGGLAVPPPPAELVAEPPAPVPVRADVTAEVAAEPRRNELAEPRRNELAEPRRNESAEPLPNAVAEPPEVEAAAPHPDEAVSPRQPEPPAAAVGEPPRRSLTDSLLAVLRRSAPERPQDSSPPASAGMPPQPTSAAPAGATAAALVTVAEDPAAIGHEALTRAGLVVGKRARSRIAEEYRIVVGRVLRAMQAGGAVHGANLLMFTSARPGEGKSFSALNCAASIAQDAHRPVLLVDIDVKHDSLTEDLGLGACKGLLDLTADATLPIAATVLPTAVPGLSVLPLGTRAAEGQVLARPVSATIERLGRSFPDHVVVLDAPPCLSTSEPSNLAALVGQIVMVVEAEETQRNELESALELVRACPSITLLLNKVKLTTSYTFGAYHYFGTYS